MVLCVPRRPQSVGMSVPFMGARRLSHSAWPSLRRKTRTCASASRTKMRPPPVTGEEMSMLSLSVPLPASTDQTLPEQQPLVRPGEYMAL